MIFVPTPDRIMRLVLLRRHFTGVGVIVHVVAFSDRLKMRVIRVL
jgi:hypothetical protein